jgi:hypothetical protein
MLYKGVSLRLIICVCYRWEIALHIGLEVTFDNIEDWKGIRVKGGKLIV